MSIGLILIKIFTFAKFKVYIFGFDLNKNKENYTYYFNDRIKSLTQAHDWDQENEIISKMIKTKKYLNYKSNDLHIYFIELIVDINLELLLFKNIITLFFF